MAASNGPTVQLVNPASIISDFKKGNLHVDFLEMTLLQNSPSDNAISYNGRGYIRQTEEGALEYKLYANETRNSNYIVDFRRQFEVQSGEVLPEDSYFTLTGVAANGGSWKAEHVIPKCDWHAQHADPIVYGKLSSVTGGEPPSNPKAIALHFFEKTDLPILNNESKFGIGDSEFHIESGDDNFIVRAKSNSPLPEHFAIRIEEALRFLLAQSVTPRVIVQPNCVTLISKTLKSPMIRLGPPISRGSEGFHDNSWGLFGTYLDYVTRETNFANWNACTGYLHMAHEASANSLDAWAMGLGVAVEGLASLINFEQDAEESNKRAEEKARLKELQNFIVDRVSNQDAFSEFTERVRGLVAGLTSVRAIDRMRWLSSLDKIDPSHIEAWRRLRNSSVHPKSRGEVDIASVDFQKMIDEVHCVTVLLYHIVFHIIGYSGPYTDYATRNFPVKNYPLTVAS
ncbi:MAG: hypothetical protein RID42_17215 [Alphaproteobacteria bacterium]